LNTTFVVLLKLCPGPTFTQVFILLYLSQAILPESRKGFLTVGKLNLFPMAGTWHGLANQPAFNTSTMILLTDGRVMVQEEATQHWHALQPDSTGSYLNGTWQSLADMSIWRRYYASGTLKDGRVVICGGEQTGAGGDTTRGEIYDPVADSWSPIPAPTGWSTVGDAACCILPDGRLMIGALTTTQCAIYDPVTNSWSAAANTALRTNEESWVLLPDGTIVTVQCFSPYQAEKYIISSNVWKSEGTPPVTLVNPNMNEIGPAVLLYSGKVIFFGAESSSGHGKTAIYTPPLTPGGTGTWVAGPDIPQIAGTAMVCNDCPCTLMPNGKVLVTTANYLSTSWGSPVNFFEYDPVTNSMYAVPNPSNNNSFPYTNNPGLYWSRMMLLPSGEVMFSASSTNVQVYIPDGAPQDSWRPHIDTINAHYDAFLPDYFTVTGTQVNGLSQANMYGDDCTPSTNYPIARLTDHATGNVYYQRTYDFSTMAVATGSAIQSFRFSALGLPSGNFDLTIIANGISSNVVTVGVQIRLKNILDVRYKRELEITNKEVAEGDPWDKLQWIGDPEIVELKSQVRSLQNSVKRLTSMIKTSELPGVGKEVKEKEIKSNGKQVKGAAKLEA
jgi:hypothetical protein